ncbi:MAG: nitrogen regulation protein NR(II) [Phycisphaerae bacterium]
MDTTPTPAVLPHGPAADLGKLATAALDALPLGAVIFNHRGRALWQNPASRRILGSTLDLSDWRTQHAGAALDWPRELQRVLATGRAVRYTDLDYRGADGRVWQLHVEARPLPIREGPPAGLLLIEDATQACRVATREAVSQKLAALGTLSAKVAHELNNPLDGSLRFLNLALRIAGDQNDDRIQRYLNDSITAHRRMMGVVAELLHFAHKSHNEHEVNDVNTLLGDALRLVAGTEPDERRSFVCDFAGWTPRVRGDALFQVFCNLIRNALDATPDGGALLLETLVVDDHVVIRVQDDGVGLPPERDRIFEPFFTTKPRGGGTGLGLALCRELVVEQLGGQLEARPAHPCGTVFEVRLPLRSCIGDPPRRAAGAIEEREH